MKGELRTVRQLIRGVRERWRDQYCRKGTWPDPRYGLDKKAVYDRLCLLDLETCSAADVDAAIGVGGWVDLSCHACGKGGHPVVVEVGEEPDYESRTASLCYPCALHALAAFDCTSHEDCSAHPTTLGRECARATLSPRVEEKP